ncbi:hypothetical protein C1T31_10500 [Hanstruepera neustonica]|uniref:Uncharacterized protein n=1 Tax=Hanstruepera neustonica TaxID=1445657 RepID=A0A2K1DX21_9FLAO|nr:hypothetical protein [Hanstruepera neustonica]PNQ72576.1 hypothetical protein C1T31_10500 [Hanstruepera neustonica]
MNYKHLFLLGLLFFLIGQILLAQGQDFVYNQQPIDFAHWFLLLGAVCLMPQVVQFPKKLFSYVGIPLTIIGIACIIGMCVLDFIWWSYPNEEARIEFTKHISNVPSIWKPFISIGSTSKVFNLGLTLLALNYFKHHKWGVGLIVLGTLVLMHIIPVPYRLVVGYTLTFIGFSFVFLKRDSVPFSI